MPGFNWMRDTADCMRGVLLPSEIRPRVSSTYACSSALAVLFLLLAGCFGLCYAPKGVLVTLGAGTSGNSGPDFTTAAAAAATATASVLAASFAMRRQYVSSSSAPQVSMDSAPPAQPQRPSTSKGKGKGKLLGMPRAMPTSAQPAAHRRECNTGGPCTQDAVAHDSDVDAYGSGDDSGDSEDDEAAVDRGKNGQLWTKAEFPEGMTGFKNWDLENVKAAQEWECPCPDRRNCIGGERMGLLDLVFYRKNWRLSVAPNEGGLRDSCRKEMSGHFDEATKQCTRSFRIGPCADCCAASAALAKGMSFAHFSRARADLRHSRPWHAGRVQAKADLESEQRVHLRSYIMQMRDTMEGPKGGSDPNDKWHTDYVPLPKRWEAYKKARSDQGLPWMGSLTMFREEWKASSVREDKSCGHAKCTRCGRLDALEEKYAGRADKIKEIQELKVCNTLPT